MRVQLQAFLALLFTISLAACGPSASSGPQLYPLTVDANPLTVTPTLDSARAVTVDVPRSGGSVTATGADGTVYTLTLPEAALLEDVTVTMTPVTKLDGLPLGDGAFGVQLEPEGQRFADLVTLTIAPPSSVPVAEQLPIGWSGASNVVSLAVVDPAQKAFTLKLAHFSGYALLLAKKGMSASIEGVRHRFGGTAEDRLNSAMAEQAQRARERLEGGSAADLDLTSLMTQYEEQVLKPRLAAASMSCANAKLFLSSMFGYERQRQLLGLQGSAFFQPSRALELVARACMKEEFELCRDEHIITRVLPVYLQLDRQAQLLGLYDPVEMTTLPPFFLQEVQDFVRRCLSFELDLTSSYQFQAGQSGDSRTVVENVHVRAAAVFTLPADGIYAPSLPQVIVLNGALITGTAAPLTSSGYSVTYPTCSVVNSVTEQQGQLGVAYLLFTPKAGGPAQRAQVEDFLVSPTIVPSMTKYNVTLKSPGANGCMTSSTVDRFENWSFQAWEAIVEAAPHQELGVAIRNWDVAGGDILATKDLSFAKGDQVQGRTTGTATLVLFHRPQ